MEEEYRIKGKNALKTVLKNEQNSEIQKRKKMKTQQKKSDN